MGDINNEIDYLRTVTGQQSPRAEVADATTEYAPLQPPPQFYEDQVAQELTARVVADEAVAKRNKTKRMGKIGAMVAGGALLAGAAVYKGAEMLGLNNDASTGNSPAEKVYGHERMPIRGMELYDKPEFILKDGDTNYSLTFRVRVADHGGELMYNVEIPTMSPDLAQLREQVGNANVVHAGEELNPVITGSLQVGKEFKRTVEFVIAGSRNDKSEPVVTKTVVVKDESGKVIGTIENNKPIKGESHYEPVG